MPLYEYHCDHCDEEFETLRSLKERDNAECPECGRPARRLLSGFAVGGGSSGGGGLPSVSSGASCNVGGG
jgi:putative FmdB family regulatory protein